MVQRNRQSKTLARSDIKYLSLCVSSVPVILGTVVALLILAFGGLMTFVLCLHYTGFICKLKATLPRALVRNFFICLCVCPCFYILLFCIDFGNDVTHFSVLEMPVL